MKFNRSPITTIFLSQELAKYDGKLTYICWYKDTIVAQLFCFLFPSRGLQVTQDYTGTLIDKSLNRGTTQS